MCYGVYPSDLTNKMSVFFLRTTPGIVPLPNSFDETDVVLPHFFDFGLLNSHPLFMLNQMLTKIYTPLLSYKGDDRLLVGHKAAGSRKAIKPAGEEEEDVVDKVDSEKAARVSSRSFGQGQVQDAFYSNQTCFRNKSTRPRCEPCFVTSF